MTEKPKYEKPEYRDKFWLLNKAELQLYQHLVEAMPKMLVFAQVSMSQVFHINKFKKGSFQQIGEIGRKSIDFLVCRADDTSIVTAVELNGPTHETEKQKASDEKKRAALLEAGIPLVIFFPDQLPDVKTIREEMAKAIVWRKKYEAERDARIGRGKA